MLILTSNLDVSQKAEDILPKPQRLLAVLSIHLLLPGVTAAHSCPLVSLISLKHSPCLTPQGESLSLPLSNLTSALGTRQMGACRMNLESANELQTVHMVRTCNLASQQLEQWTTRTRLTLWVFRLLR